MSLSREAIIIIIAIILGVTLGGLRSIEGYKRCRIIYDDYFCDNNVSL